LDNLRELLPIPAEPVSFKIKTKRRIEEGDMLAKMNIKQTTWIASTLWTEMRWKSVLMEHGFRWQDLMKVIRECYYSFLDWIEGKKSWEDTMNYVILNIEREIRQY